MIKYIILISISFLFACSSSNNTPSDFSLSYSSKNVLMNWEVNITVEGETLKLNYKNKQNSTNGNGVYEITEAESKTIYSYMKSSGFLSMEQPAGEKVVDYPSQNLNGKLSGKSNSIEFGTVKNPPETLTTLKQILFDLTSKYNSKWKKDMNLE